MMQHKVRSLVTLLETGRAGEAAGIYDLTEAARGTRQSAHSLVAAELSRILLYVGLLEDLVMPPLERDLPSHKTQEET